MSKLQIESWEDRSGAETPGKDSFGFVYFSDGSRVGFSPSRQDTSAPAHQMQVWQPQTNGGGQFKAVSGKHLDLAEALLKAVGVMT
jgi:hypothetical protein